jgi:aspartate-semialdehyde dehydrogenase
MATDRGLRIAIIGSDTLRGKEIQSVLAGGRIPVKSVEFYDPDVQEEYSKLSQFGEEPKVVHHLDPAMLEGLDLVILAVDPRPALDHGHFASGRDYRTLDLSESWNDRPDVPVVVAGVNDDLLAGAGVSLAANPSPAAVILAHLLAPVERAFGIERAVSVILEPVSAFEEKGIQELYDQSVAMLGSTSMPKKVFHGQVAFNLVSHLGRLDSDGFSERERRVLSELRRVLQPGFHLSLSVVLAPVFHTYSVMTYLELKRDTDPAGLRACYMNSPLFDVAAGQKGATASSVTVAGKDSMAVGPIKKDSGIPRGFWIWGVADNLTFGSARNACELIRAWFKLA